MKTSAAYFLLATLLVSTTAQAEEPAPRPELEIGSSIGLNAGPNGDIYVETGNATRTTINFGGMIAFFVTDNLQIAVNPRFYTSSINGGSESSFSFTFGPRFNFGGDTLANQAFVYAGPGYVRSSATGFNTASSFRFALAAGKRFQLASWLSYAPSVTYTGTTWSAGYRSAISITPIGFSFFL